MSPAPPPPPALARLRDGRLLEYASFGDPAGLPAFFFHGFIGSHHQARFAHGAAARHGLRLVAVNRPGVGRSTAHARRVMADVVPDIEELADSLGVGRFAAIGASGGAPYALALMARLPARVLGAVVISGMGPVCEAGALAAMKPYARLALRGGRLFPLGVRWALETRARLYRRDPEGFLEAILSRWSRPDQELFARPENRALFLADLHEVLAVGQGPRAMAHELGLYFRWGFDLGEIDGTRPLLFWHGLGDVLVPPGVCRYVAARLPSAEVTLCPGGHFMVLERADEVMRRAVAVMRE